MVNLGGVKGASALGTGLGEASNTDAHHELPQKLLLGMTKRALKGWPALLGEASGTS